jgi:hypothetical protein
MPETPSEEQAGADPGQRGEVEEITTENNKAASASKTEDPMHGNAPEEKTEENVAAEEETPDDSASIGKETSSNPEDDEAEPTGDDPERKEERTKRDVETETDATADSVEEKPEKQSIPTPTAIVSSSKKSRPPYKYDPKKITLRFLFANKDGLTVTVECNPSDTVGEVKGALISVWPEGKP